MASQSWSIERSTVPCTYNTTSIVAGPANTRAFEVRWCFQNMDRADDYIAARLESNSFTMSINTDISACTVPIFILGQMVVPFKTSTLLIDLGQCESLHQEISHIYPDRQRKEAALYNLYRGLGETKGRLKGFPQSRMLGNTLLGSNSFWEQFACLYGVVFGYMMRDFPLPIPEDVKDGLRLKYFVSHLHHRGFPGLHIE